MSTQDDAVLREALRDWKPQVELISCRPVWAHTTGQGDCVACRMVRGEIGLETDVPLSAHQVEDSA